MVLNSLVPTLCNRFSLLASRSMNIRDILAKYFWIPCCHFTAGVHIWIQFLLALARFFIIFNLSPTPFPLNFFFVLFCIWLLRLDLKLYFKPDRTQHLLFYSLGSIHFQFCFKCINPCFTMLCNQVLILSIAIGLNCHTFYPRQPKQCLIFCTSH